MRSRIFLCILIIFLIPIVGCNGDKNDIKLPRGAELEGSVIRIFELKDAFADREKAAQYRTRAIELANKYNITIEYVGDGSRVQLEEQINLLLTGYSDCDVLAVDSVYSHRLIADSVFQPIDNYTEDLKLNKSDYWNTAAMDATLNYNNRLYGIVPYESAFERVKGMTFLAFNRTIAGDKPFELQESGHWNYDEFSKLTSQLTDKEKNIWGIVPNGDNLLLGLKAARTTIVSYSDKGYACALHSQPVNNILDLILGMNGKGLRTPKVREAYGTEQHLFNNDSVGMMPVDLNNFSPQVPDKIGLALFPSPTGRELGIDDYYFPVCGVVDKGRTAQSAFIMAQLYSGDKAPDNKQDAAEVIRRLGINHKYINTVEKAFERTKYTSDAAYIPLPIGLSELLMENMDKEEYLLELQSKINYRIKGIWQADRVAG